MTQCHDKEKTPSRRNPGEIQCHVRWADEEGADVGVPSPPGPEHDRHSSDEPTVSKLIDLTGLKMATGNFRSTDRRNPVNPGKRPSNTQSHGQPPMNQDDTWEIPSIEDSNAGWKEISDFLGENAMPPPLPPAARIAQLKNRKAKQTGGRDPPPLSAAARMQRPRLPRTKPPRQADRRRSRGHGDDVNARMKKHARAKTMSEEESSDDDDVPPPPPPGPVPASPMRKDRGRHNASSVTGGPRERTHDKAKISSRRNRSHSGHRQYEKRRPDQDGTSSKRYEHRPSSGRTHDSRRTRDDLQNRPRIYGQREESLLPLHAMPRYHNNNDVGVEREIGWGTMPKDPHGNIYTLLGHSPKHERSGDGNGMFGNNPFMIM